MVSTEISEVKHVYPPTWSLDPTSYDPSPDIYYYIIEHKGVRLNGVLFTLCPGPLSDFSQMHYIYITDKGRRVYVGPNEVNQVAYAMRPDTMSTNQSEYAVMINETLEEHCELCPQQQTQP